jgi:hypothetical protein
MTLIEMLVFIFLVGAGCAVGVLFGRIFSDHPHWYHLVLGIVAVFATLLTADAITTRFPRKPKE